MTPRLDVPDAPRLSEAQLDVRVGPFPAARFTSASHSCSSSGVIFRLVPLVGSVTNGGSGDGDPAGSVSLIAVKYIARLYGTDPSRPILTVTSSFR